MIDKIIGFFKNLFSKKETGAVVNVVHKGGRPRKPIPKEFIDVAHKLTINELSERYGVSTATISRWLRKCGIYKSDT